MQVLSVFPSLDPALGGTQSGGSSLVLAGIRAGMDHTVVCADHPESHDRSAVLIAELEDAGATVRTFAQLARPATLARRWSVSPSEIPWLIRNVGRFDVVHVHGAWHPGALGALAAARARGVPVVVTAHESFTEQDIGESRSGPRRAQKLLLKSLYLRWATRFVLTSELETTTSLPAGAPAATIPYALVSRETAPPPAEPRGRRAELTVGYLGRIAPKKNVPLLVDAMACLPERVRLEIAGSGDAEIEDDARARATGHGIEDRVTWLGFVRPDARPQFLERIDVLAMPSVFESFGMSAAEAMLAGVPVVVTHRCGIAEVIARRGGGVVVDGTPEAVAEAIAGLEGDRDRLAAMGAAAQAAILGELDADRIGQLLRGQYEIAMLGSAA